MTPVDIVNTALDNIGARMSITSLNPPLPPPNAAVCARQYQLRIDALFRAAHWNCARRQTSNGLTLLKAKIGTPENPNGAMPQPPIPWSYEYGYPADCLAVRFLISNPPTTGSTVPPILSGGVMQTNQWCPPIGYKFAVAIDTDAGGSQIKVILTDLEFAQAVYTARIDNPDLWDPHFQNAASATLGAWLVNPLARNAQVLKEQIEIAKAIIIGARISDGNEGVTSTDHDPDWMRVRGSTGYGYLMGPGVWAAWDSMGFPGGIIV